MKVLSIEVRDAEITNNRRSPARAKQTVVYVFHAKESIIENLGNRAARPSALYKKAFGEEVAKLLNVKVSDLRWSQKAGCACGCSPGFRVTGSWHKKVIVTVGPDEIKTTDPELAAARIKMSLLPFMPPIKSETDELMEQWERIIK